MARRWMRCVHGADVEPPMLGCAPALAAWQRGAAQHMHATATVAVRLEPALTAIWTSSPFHPASMQAAAFFGVQPTMWQPDVGHDLMLDAGWRQVADGLLAWLSADAQQEGRS